jgi:hypothetical protein
MCLIFFLFLLYVIYLSLIYNKWYKSKVGIDSLIGGHKEMESCERLVCELLFSHQIHKELWRVDLSL